MSAKVMEQLAGRPVAFGCVDLKTATSMPGVEFLRGMMSGTFPAPPIAEVLDFLLVEADVGRAVFDADVAVDWVGQGERVVLVRIETSPDDFHGMAVAQGILTARGGATSHAAVVARQIGKPCVAG